MEPVQIKELKERLKKEKIVEINGLAFRIRKVPLLLLAEGSDDLWELARQGKDALTQKIKELVTSPSLSRLRRVLLKGVVLPPLSEMDEEDSVSVDLLLADYQLSAGLFIEIINFSLEV